METHAFLFSPGLWLGQGIISFSMAEDQLKFYARWAVEPVKEGVLRFTQEIEVNSFTDKMFNSFEIAEISPTGFDIQIQNGLIGKVTGKGIVNPKIIAWEFKDNPQNFEGYEIYEKKEDGTYLLRSEFFAGDGLRTIIQGSLWKKQGNPSEVKESSQP